MTTSSLTITPKKEDHDKIITCRAENPKVDGGVEEDTWKLNIYCKFEVYHFRTIFSL